MTFDFQDSSLLQKAVQQCEFLTEDQAKDFITNGFVVIKSAFSQEIAERICTTAWDELQEVHDISAKDRSSWRGKPDGYIRTSGQKLQIRLIEEAPQARQAQLDILGGSDRLPNEGRDLSLHGGIIANFGVDGDSPWQPPGPHQNGWHKDGWHFRHFLDSPEQGLLTVPIYTEILPESGGTFLAKDSIAPVARLLSKQPEGFHADGTQGNGYLIPYLVEQCSEFVELTGEPGDLAIVHPYMLHRRTVNPSDRPRFIANLAIVLKEPMNFNRDAEDAYSLTELAVLHALGEESINFNTTSPRAAYMPTPFRDKEDFDVQRGVLLKEMAEMANRGVVTPAWAESFGYMSNR